MLVSIVGIVLAVKSSESRYGLFFLLLAIWILILGLFGLALQNYCARVAKNIDEEDKRKKDDNVA